jgi:hypothetical protein
MVTRELCKRGKKGNWQRACVSSSNSQILPTAAENGEEIIQRKGSLLPISIICFIPEQSR